MSFAEFQEAVLIVAGEGLVTILVFMSALMVLIAITTVLFDLVRRVWQWLRE